MQIRIKIKDNAIATKIFKQRVNFDFYINVIGEQDSDRS